MSALLEVTEKLHDTRAAIERLETVVANNPDSASIHLSLRSLQKRQRDLEAQLAEIIAAEHVELSFHNLTPEKKEYGQPQLLTLIKTLYASQVLANSVFRGLHMETPQGMKHIGVDEIHSIRKYFDSDEVESLLRLEEAEAAHRRRKESLLLNSVLAVLCITIFLCIWVIVKGGTAESNREWAVPLLTAIATGLAGYATGRTTR